MLDRRQIKQKARRRVKGRCLRTYLTVFPLFLVTTLPFLLCTVAIWVPALRDLRGIFARTPQLLILRDVSQRALLHSAIVTSIWLGLGGPITLSLRAYFLMLRRHRNRAGIYDALVCFSSYARYFRTNAWLSLWTALHFAPCAFFFFAYVLLHSPSFAHPPATAASFAALALAIVGLFWGVWRVARYAMTPYLLHDLPSASGRELLRASKALMRARRLSYLAFQLSFTPLRLLSFTTLGLANVYILPYRMTASAVYYGAARRGALQTAEEREPLPHYAYAPGPNRIAPNQPQS